jgi:hypothetical protein
MSDVRDFEFAGHKFKMNKINALIQFHIVRRIGPLLADLMPAMSKISKVKADAMSEEEKILEFARIAQPLMNGLAQLSDKDSEYVLFRLLTAVEIFQPTFNSWARVASDSGIMMQDIELPILMQAAGRSLAFNLKGFFSLMPQK